ncbi:phosphonate ABC transporter substrate-binding protein [Cryobacterium melibiosiphilum]|uniref:Phosphonate ABC transporter substrate-binding protein n=1 Tax=Cryobacterium melibiosiphilum TaxID=995039 RepID=A0A3A5MJV8_9MICO|nr:PhnD/SsuA/transferrin family substrate-binding protein [Cryobacterium melibiosiphilum]RJT87318.1 phosphonate ABC transporter substrate-binding protein [Cryobacterium melibiosiphilum]
MRVSKTRTLPALFVVGALALTGCASTATGASDTNPTATGSEACPDTLRFSDTGVEGLETLVVEFENFRLAFEEATGKDIEFYPISSRTAASTALEFDEIDLLLTGPAEYVVLKQEADALPVVGITRPGYRSIIVARADSDVDELSDLENKTVITKEVGSTSGHLGPLEMLADAGLVAGETVDVVPLGATRIEAFGAGEGDALGTGLSDFEEIEAELGKGSIKMVAEGPDLPNDLFVARSALGENCATWLQQTLTENQQVLLDAITSTGESDKYLESEFLVAEDADYDPTRSAFVAAGFEDFAQLPE